MSSYKQLISREKLNMITTLNLALTTTPNHKGFILDLSFVRVYITHSDKEKSGIWGLKTGSFVRHVTRK